MASTYWIEESLAGLLPALWMFLGVGAPWAFAVISVRCWHSRSLIGATALALGPAWMTAWMLVLGIAGAQLERRLLTPEWILPGSAVIAAAGGIIAWRKRGGFGGRIRPAPPIAFDEKLIIGLITAAVIARWIHTAFWPFTAYDALWVFGYQGRLFFLEGNIPNAIDYYPPFLSLQFAYVQALIGAINDHAARMVIPVLHIGSILAAYALGRRLANRRAGLAVAALWSLHPFVGQWAVIGDLEIPLAFSFTLAAAFFLRAWDSELAGGERRREALLAGVMLGIALFTKPTAGAFIWGIGLLLAYDLLRARFDPRRWRPRLEVAIWTGLACLPLGGIWYLRNLALGHEAVTLPKAIWLSRALRSGDYLAPLVVAAVLVYLALAIRLKLKRREYGLGALGILLLLAGALAANPILFPERADPPASYVAPAEAAAIVAGLAFCGYSLRARDTTAGSEQARRRARAGGWALLLALPYFVTYFFSYSYHYRLGFAILPLLCLPTGIALAALLNQERLRRWSSRLRRAYYLTLLCLGLPGIAAAAVNVTWSALPLVDDSLDSDYRKYQVFNPSLLEVVYGLEDYMRESERAPIVLAPGEERLPFFFPQLQILDEPAASLAQYEASGATHFIFGAKAREAYWEAGLDPLGTQLVAALGRPDLFESVREHFDGTLSYELHQSQDISSRRRLPGAYSRGRRNSIVKVFGDQIRLRTDGVYPEAIWRNTPITLELTWRALVPLERDLEFVLRLGRLGSDEVFQEWKLQTAAHRHGHYATTHWETAEYVNERQILFLDDEAQIPRGGGYIFSIGVWDPQGRRFLPLKINSAAAGEFLLLPGVHTLRT